MKGIVSIIAVLCLPLAFVCAQTEAQSKDQGIRLFGEALKLQKKAQTYQDMKRAVEKYERALRIFEEIGWKKGVGLVANNLGVVFGDSGQYDKPVAYYEKSLAICRELNDRGGEGGTLNNLGNVCTRPGVNMTR